MVINLATRQYFMKINKTMLVVKNELCIGCGICARNCPQGAISLQVGKAKIDPVRCNGCGVCVNGCPQYAIREYAPVSGDELAVTVGSLKQKADELAERIEKLREKA